jgi:hypothetical protein
MHPSIVKLAKTVAEQRRSAAEAHKKAAAGKAQLQQAQQERLALQARAERCEEELRFFRAAESRSNSRASVGPCKEAPSATDSLAAMGAAHERAAVAEGELAQLQARANKLQSEVAAVRSETLDGFKGRLSTALAEVSSIEREVRLQVQSVDAARFARLLQRAPCPSVAYMNPQPKPYHHNLRRLQKPQPSASERRGVRHQPPGQRGGIQRLSRQRCAAIQVPASITRPAPCSIHARASFSPAACASSPTSKRRRTISGRTSRFRAFSCGFARQQLTRLPQALVRRLDAFATLESGRIHELQKLRGEVRDIGGGGGFSALDHLDRQLAAAGGGLFPSIGGGSAREGGSRRGGGTAGGGEAAGKAKVAPVKKKKG